MPVTAATQLSMIVSHPVTGGISPYPVPRDREVSNDADRDSAAAWPSPNSEHCRLLPRCACGSWQESPMAYTTAPRRRSLPGMLAAGAIELVLVWLVMRGLAAHFPLSTIPSPPSLVAFSVHQPEPPARPPPPPEKAQGESAPPALKAKPATTPPHPKNI